MSDRKYLQKETKEFVRDAMDFYCEFGFYTPKEHKNWSKLRALVAEEFHLENATKA